MSDVPRATAPVTRAHSFLGGRTLAIHPAIFLIWSGPPISCPPACICSSVTAPNESSSCLAQPEASPGTGGEKRGGEGGISENWGNGIGPLAVSNHTRDRAWRRMVHMGMARGNPSIS